MSTKKKYNFTPFQRQWIDALKSGRFRQAQGILHHSNPKRKIAQYCCLGVACKLTKSEGLCELEVEHDNYHGMVTYNNQAYTLPQPVVDLLKLRDTDGELKSAHEELTSLAEMNDEGWSHKKIGEYIENNPHNVFKE